MAAASFSISRAAAPAWRSGCMNARTLVLPPVPCRWNAGFWYASSTGAISIRTFCQSHSSSSARIIGSEVYTP